MPKPKRELSSQALAAKNIRKELKAAFPGTKFSVRSESFAGGNAVDVSWTDGPTSSQVDKIIGKYQYGNFNGMEDIYEYTEGFDSSNGSAKYVHGSRNLSPEIRENIETIMRDKLPEDVKGYEFDQWVWGSEGENSIPPGAEIIDIEMNGSMFSSKYIFKNNNN